MAEPDVKIGQVWRDGDKRMKGRTVTIEGVKVTYVSARNNFGRLTRIRLDRFDGKQYVLVSPDA